MPMATKLPPKQLSITYVLLTYFSGGERLKNFSILSSHSSRSGSGHTILIHHARTPKLHTAHKKHRTIFFTNFHFFFSKKFIDFHSYFKFILTQNCKLISWNEILLIFWMQRNKCSGCSFKCHSSQPWPINFSYMLRITQGSQNLSIISNKLLFKIVFYSNESIFQHYTFLL